MPLVVDLFDTKEVSETGVDNPASFSPASPGTMEEAGPSCSPNGTKEQLPEKADPVAEDASLKLKQLEAEISPMLVSQSNVNINKQEEVIKLTEKCLNNAVESPRASSGRLPPDIKSNILKAQAEAGHKVVWEDDTSGSKNTNIQDAASRSIFLAGKVHNSPLRGHSPLFQDSKEGVKAVPVSNAFIPNELNEGNSTCRPEEPSSPPDLPLVEEAALAKNSPQEPEVLLASQVENLIDFTEAMPRVSLPPTTGPRWLVPSGLVSNGPLGTNVALVLKTVKGSSEVLPVPASSPPTLCSPENMPSSAAEDATRPTCLLTTEL